MKIVLSTFTNSSLKELAEGPSVKRWVYFGKNENTLERLHKAFDGRADEIVYAKLLYQVSGGLRKDIVEWIDGVSFDNSADRGWLLSLTASKNPVASKLFLNTAYFFVFKKLMESKEKIDVVFVDSLALARCIEDAFAGQDVSNAPDGISIFKYNCYNFLRTVYFYLQTVSGLTAKHFKVSRGLKKRALDVLKGIQHPVFIRSYIDGNYTDASTDISERHYFPGLYDYLVKQGVSPVILPFTLNVVSYKKLFSNIAGSRKIIILPEEILRFSDYCAAFWSPFKRLGKKLRVKNFSGYNLSSLIEEDLLFNCTQYSNVYAVLMSFFAARLKSTGSAPQSIINWAENQSIEKGLVSGLRREFPDIKVIASQPFVCPSNLLYLFPSKQDEILNLVPDKVLVVGPVWRDSVKKYFNGLDIDDTPPLRYAYLFDEAPYDAQANNILVLLSYSLHNAVSTVRSFIRSIDKLKEFEHIYLKLHPMAYFDQQDLEKKLGQALPKEFVIVDGTLQSILSKASIGVCGETGACVELVSKGIPVALIAERYDLTMNYLEAKEDPSLWRLCFTEEDLVSSIKQMNRSRLEDPQLMKKKALEFRSLYFHSPQQGLWENYLARSKHYQPVN